jgi:hypothetical protein
MVCADRASPVWVRGWSLREVVKAARDHYYGRLLLLGLLRLRVRRMIKSKQALGLPHAKKGGQKLKNEVKVFMIFLNK